MTTPIVGQTADRTETNRRRADRRRDVSRAVRDMRDKLSSPSGLRPAFDREVLAGHARNLLSSFLPVALLIAAIAIAAAYWVRPDHALGWVAAAMAAHAVKG